MGLKSTPWDDLKPRIWKPRDSRNDFEWRTGWFRAKQRKKSKKLNFVFIFFDFSVWKCDFDRFSFEFSRYCWFTAFSKWNTGQWLSTDRFCFKWPDPSGPGRTRVRPVLTRPDPVGPGRTRTNDTVWMKISHMNDHLADFELLLLWVLRRIRTQNHPEMLKNLFQTTFSLKSRWKITFNIQITHTLVDTLFRWRINWVLVNPRGDTSQLIELHWNLCWFFVDFFCFVIDLLAEADFSDFLLTIAIFSVYVNRWTYVSFRPSG